MSANLFKKKSKFLSAGIEERQRDRETERQRDREEERNNFQTYNFFVLRLLKCKLQILILNERSGNNHLIEFHLTFSVD